MVRRRDRRPLGLAPQRGRALGRGDGGRRQHGRPRHHQGGEERQHGYGNTRAQDPDVVADAIAPSYRRRRFQSIAHTEPRFTQRSGRRAAGGVASAR